MELLSFSSPLQLNIVSSEFFFFANCLFEMIAVKAITETTLPTNSVAPAGR